MSTSVFGTGTQRPTMWRSVVMNPLFGVIHRSRANSGVHAGSNSRLIFFTIAGSHGYAGSGIALI